MDAEKCMYCRAIIPEGRDVCPICEYKLIKAGSILQSNNATEEEIEGFYNSFIKEESENE